MNNHNTPSNEKSFEIFRYMISGLTQTEDRKRLEESLFSDKKYEFKSESKKYEYFYHKLAHKDFFVLGVIAMNQPKSLTDKNLSPQKHDDYKPVYVIFNTNNDYTQDKMAQTVYIEENKSSLRIVQDFFESVQSSSLSDISVAPITEEKDFWNKIKNKTIKSLSITVYPPNLFGNRNKLVEEVKTLQTEMSATSVTHTVSSNKKDTGLKLKKDTSNNDLEETLELCSQGGGEIIAKDFKNKPVYDSKNKSKSHRKITSFRFWECTSDTDDCKELLEEIIEKMKRNE